MFWPKLLNPPTEPVPSWALFEAERPIRIMPEVLIKGFSAGSEKKNEANFEIPTILTLKCIKKLYMIAHES